MGRFVTLPKQASFYFSSIACSASKKISNGFFFIHWLVTKFEIQAGFFFFFFFFEEKKLISFWQFCIISYLFCNFLWQNSSKPSIFGMPRDFYKDSFFPNKWFLWMYKKLTSLVTLAFEAILRNSYTYVD